MENKTTLHFDRQWDQWCVQLENRDFPMHCGESFDLYIGKTAYPCRLELDTNWYVVMPETKFILHPASAYTVSI